MTRINVISVKELSDQWLLAEYRELPRVILQQYIYIGDAPEKYCLGKGHVKWAVLHANYCLWRYYNICEEMKFRGFKVNYPYEELDKYLDLSLNSSAIFLFFAVKCNMPLLIK